MNSLKKFISIISILGVVLVQTHLAYADPTPPTAPTPPEAPQNTTPPPPAPQPPTPDQPPPPAPKAPTISDLSNPQNSPQQTNTNASPSPLSNSNPESAKTSDDQTPKSNLAGKQDNGNVGDTTIKTGNATNTASITTPLNSNLSAGVSGGLGSVSLINSDNGSKSINSGSATTTSGSDSQQQNSANVAGNLNQTTTTGENSASRNVGNSSIKSGDANTSGTVVTAVNTNLSGMMVAEFNVIDDHRGDIVLDFSSGCLIGCSGSLSAENSGNGNRSTNTASLDQKTTSQTIQGNDATLISNLNLASNSGDNLANSNTGGNSTIKTGDANVLANVLNFANNNGANVILGIVNIFGNLVGDIILPVSLLANCPSCPGSILAKNSGNGDSSNNNLSLNQSSLDNTSQFNNVNIGNNMVLDTNTGLNQTKSNTGGNSSIETGNTSANVGVLNIANSNVSGGNWWLVIVNQAGKWIGQILGAPTGANFAGSAGTEFRVGEDGQITAVNSGNGEGSKNSINLSSSSDNQTTQTNTANIVNNLNLSANTGRNSASRNTGGNSTIKTGDASIIANIINVVNNNFSGGRLFVTVVNVFGSWLGDFAPPGLKKETSSGTSGSKPAAAGSQAGSSGSSSSSQSSNGSGSSSDSHLSTIITASQPQAQVASAFARTTLLAAESLVNIPRVAHITELAKASEATKKAININLAWALLLLPAGLAFILVRKRIINRSSNRVLT